MINNKYELDEEEQELLRSIEAGEWKSVKNIKTARSQAAAMAKNTRIIDDKSDLTCSVSSHVLQ